MPVFVQQTIFKLSTNKILKYEGWAALGTMSPGDTAVRQGGGYHERLGGSTNCQAPGWVVVSCFPICATTQHFLLALLGELLCPRAESSTPWWSFRFIKFSIQKFEICYIWELGRGVFGGPIFDKKFAIHAKLKLGKFFIFFRICSVLWELRKDSIWSKMHFLMNFIL
jgi:hypothetical protein